jgi:hypothetical protein
MFKKLLVALFLLAGVLVLLPAAPASATPKTAILVEELVYTVSEPPELPEFDVDKFKGQVIYAEGRGVIDCNGMLACEQAGADGLSVTFQQFFLFDIDGFPAAALEGFAVGTVGRLQLPGAAPDVYFKGKGSGLVTCPDESCNLSLSLEARTSSGGKLAFSLVSIHIDHTSAGIVATELAGMASYLTD